VTPPGADARAKPFWYASLQRGAERLLWVSIGGSLYQRQLSGARDQRVARRTGGQAKEILAPVPGKVIAVNVTAGSKLEAGETVLVLESMKMEFEVKATQAGTIEATFVKANDQVTAGQRLAQWSQ
jgi:biotin carboxyl carrier protein